MRLVLFINIVVFTVTVAFTQVVSAQQQEIAIKLKKLEVEKLQEKNGDELYISVTEYPTDGKPTHYQVPSFPTHWLSKYLNNVKDIVIWKKSTNQCESTDLLITLVEEDFAPWNMDDSLGSVELKVECVNGKAVEKWSIPEQRGFNKVSQEGGVFTFDSEGAKYKAQFNIEVAKPH